MYASEQYSPPRGTAAITAIAIQSGLVYLLAVGLGVAPSLPKVMGAELVDIPVEETPRSTNVEKRDFDPTGLFDEFHPQVEEPKVSVDEPIKDPPVTGGTIDVGSRSGVGSVIDPQLSLSPARVLVSHDPVYPGSSMRGQEQGTAYVRIQLGPDGKIATVLLDRSSGFSRLDEAALKAVRGWRFAPATRGGQGVSAWVVVPVTFELR